MKSGSQGDDILASVRLLEEALMATATVPAAFASFPLVRMINIRKAQGALPGYKYTSVFRALYHMPREQGGVRHVWRGVGPHIGAEILGRPASFVAKEALANAPLFQKCSGDSPFQMMVKSVGQGATAGVLVSLLTHPLKIASLRLQLDLGGGSMGPRTFPSTLSVLRQIVGEAGLVSVPFSLTGGLYRGWTASLLGAAIHRGVYFGVYDTAKVFVLSGNTTSTESGIEIMLQKFMLAWSVSNLAIWASYPFSVGVVRAQAAVAPRTSVNGVESTVQYKGALDAMVKVIAKEGVSALWRGYGLSLVSGFLGATVLLEFDYIKDSLY